MFKTGDFDLRIHDPTLLGWHRILDPEGVPFWGQGLREDVRLWTVEEVSAYIVEIASDGQSFLMRFRSEDDALLFQLRWVGNSIDL